MISSLIKDSPTAIEVGTLKLSRAQLCLVIAQTICGVAAFKFFSYLLREQLLKGTFTSVDLVNVFGKRCYTIGRRLFLTAEENFEEAMEMAKRCDQERVQFILENRVDQLPLLHGIPISVKDLFEQEGKVATIGCYECISKILRNAGAILLVRGNVPQLAYSYHSENHIWGGTLNPHSTNRTCGGSSGGDAGLVAAECVPLSVGSDISGSVRLPALFVGIYGFKPTNWRVMTTGKRNALEKNFTQFTQIKPTAGPMGKSVEDLKICMQVLLDSNISRIDSYQSNTIFNEEKYQLASQGKIKFIWDLKIKVGYLKSLTTNPLTDSAKAAIDLAVAALEKQGFELVAFDIPEEEIWLARDIMNGLLSNKMMKPLLQNLHNHYEKPLDSYRLPWKLLTHGSIGRWFIMQYYIRPSIILKFHK